MNRRIYIAATGAGAGAQDLIWSTPGCSSYFAGATFPYGDDQLEEFIGYRPDKFVSPDVAIEMAMKAYQCAWRGPADDAVGIGCTAAVATNRLRKGDYVAYVASVSNKGVDLYTSLLQPETGAFYRIKQGNIVDRLITQIISEHSVPDDCNYVDEASSKARLLLKTRPYIDRNCHKHNQSVFESQVVNGPTDSSDLVKRAIFPGAFNPVHFGHIEIAKRTGAVFNIEISPPHKGPLSVCDILQRLKLLRGHDVLLSDGLPLYLDKSNAFRNHSLVMGADAFIRMLDPVWGVNPIDILNQMSQNNTRIYVFGREVDGKFVSATDAISLVPESATCYDLVPIDGQFNVSSSQIRKGN